MSTTSHYSLRSISKTAAITALLMNAVFIPESVCKEPSRATLNTAFTENRADVAPGLLHIHLRSDSITGASPLNINILAIDLGRFTVKIALAKDQIQGQETTSSMVKRLGAAAGINGGFFATHDPDAVDYGDPVGLLAIDGVILSNPVEPRRSLGILDMEDGTQRIFMARPSLRAATVFSGAPPLSITALNRARGPDELICYTPQWGATTLTDQNGCEAVIRNAVIAGLFPGAGSSRIPAGGFVLSGSGRYADTLQARVSSGSKAALLLRLHAPNNPDDTLPLHRCSYVSAGPALVLDGKKIIDYAAEGFKRAFCETRHPRTAAGVSRTGQELFLVVVDGRLPGTSAGMSLPELAAFMADRGAHEAYNLDGGGSSAMAIGGRVVNRICEATERPVSDALLLFQKERQDPF